MLRAIVSGLCAAHAVGTGEHGALMQSQANTEDLDAILLATQASSDKPRLAKHHSSHGSHERSRQKLTELQSNAQMLEQKYRAILHAKVEKTATATSRVVPTAGAKRKPHEFVAASEMFDDLDDLLAQMQTDLLDEKRLNQELMDKANETLTNCNIVRHDNLSMPRFMDYYTFWATSDHFCTGYETCYTEGKAIWDELKENTQILEKTQKLIWKVMGKARCYVSKIRKSNPSREDIAFCVNEDVPTHELNIKYDPVAAHFACTPCQLENASIYEWTQNGDPRTRHDPSLGIMNTIDVMIEMLEKKGLIDQFEMEQSLLEEYNNHLAECNTAKTNSWAEETIDQLSSDAVSARGTHKQCRVREVPVLKAMQADCKDFSDKRSSCDWPYWFDPHGGNASLDATIAAGQVCHKAIVDSKPLSAECDANQATFEEEFCEYFNSKNTTCWEHDICWDRRSKARDDIEAEVRDREKQMRLQQHMLEINKCFIDLMQGAQNAQTHNQIEGDAMTTCAARPCVKCEAIKIDYGGEFTRPAKQACDYSDVLWYPGESEWEDQEYSATPFSDLTNSYYMADIESCSFHSSGLTPEPLARINHDHYAHREHLMGKKVNPSN